MGLGAWGLGLGAWGVGLTALAHSWLGHIGPAAPLFQGLPAVFAVFRLVHPPSDLPSEGEQRRVPEGRGKHFLRAVRTREETMHCSAPPHTPPPPPHISCAPRAAPHRPGYLPGHRAWMVRGGGRRGACGGVEGGPCGDLAGRWAPSGGIRPTLPRAGPVAAAEDVATLSRDAPARERGCECWGPAPCVQSKQSLSLSLYLSGPSLSLFPLVLRARLLERFWPESGHSPKS